MTHNSSLIAHNWFYGELAQLARAPALHAGGHRFDSDILHDECFKRRNRNEKKTESLLFSFF